tara:strand:+ start:93 stop:560 length:468 start_codon:yes stop_codon:yes gene_type:complete
MRIKKKYIREGLGSEKEAEIEQMQSAVTDTIDGIATSFKASGIPDEESKKLSSDIVSSAFNENNSDDHFGDDEKIDIEVGADDYEEYQELLKNIGNHGNPIDLDSVEDGLPFESVRPKMTKSELVESVKNIGKNFKTSRKVVKTFKVKNLKNGKK